MPDAQSFVHRIESLPTLPAAATQLAGLIEDQTAGAPQFVEVIRPDISLTTSVLRLCNSAFFGLSREITSIQQAVTLLGTKRIFELAISSSMAKMLRDVIVGYEMEARSFWLHCVAVGVLVERIANKVPAPKPDLAFVSGLLHDIGRLAIGIYLEDHGQEELERIRQSGQPLSMAEVELIGVAHTEVGAELAVHWKLPDVIHWGAMYHHSPGTAPQTVNLTLVDLVHVADRMANKIGLGCGTEEVPEEIDGTALVRLKVRDHELDEIATESMDDIVALSKLLIAG